MNEIKGLTPVFAVALLLIVGVGLSASVYFLFDGFFTEGDFNTDESLSAGDISMDYVERENVFRPSLRVKNSGDAEETVTINKDEGLVFDGKLEPNSVEVIDLGCLLKENDKIVLEAENFELEERTDVSDGYCINVTSDQKYFTGGSDSYREWNGTVYRNNENRDPYAEKDLDVELGRSKRKIRTDSNGNFSITTEWDVTYLPKNKYWSYDTEYSSSDTYQPPNRAGFKFNDSSEAWTQTQMGISGTSSSHQSHNFTVEPLKVEDDRVRLRVQIGVEMKQDIVDDVNNNPNSKLLYQIPMRSGGSYPIISNIDCYDDSDMTCKTEQVSPQMSSDIDGKSLSRSSLPTNSAGKKYIPIDREIHSSKDVVFGYNSYDRVYDKDSSTYHRLAQDKRMIYIPGGGNYEFYRNYTLEDINNTIKSDGGVSNPNLNTRFESDRQLIGTAHAWTNYPYLGTNFARFDLNDTHPSSASFTPDTTEAVTYEWSSVSLGKKSSFGFNVTLERDATNDKTFLLPTNLGVFGVFPQNGGEAVSTGSRYDTYQSGITRNVIPQRDRPAFKTTIPKIGSSKPIVYKIFQRSGNYWETSTHVLNTADQRIEEIYLLDSRGDWVDIIGDVGTSGFPDPGKNFSYSFSIDSSPESVTKINLRFQTINWSTSRPAQVKWPYGFNLSIQGNSLYKYNLSGTVTCNYRYCNSYRTGNRDTSRAIDNLRGKDAPKSEYGEEIQSATVDLENYGSSSEYQGFRRFKFWIWDLQPVTSDIQDKISNPEYLKIKTDGNEFVQPGFYRDDY